MAPVYVFPTSIELTRIAQDLLPVLTMNDPLFDFFPMNTKDAAVVAWEQKDNYKGLQQLRGLGGVDQRVNRVGAKRFIYEPGFYGEYVELGEQELMNRRPYGQLDGTIDLTDLVLEAQEQLLQRRINRIRQIAWTLVTTGTFSISNAVGSVMHTDTYPVQTSSGSAWGTPATGTPLQDFRAVQLLSRGHSVNFGSKAKAFMNRTTFNKLTANTNAADLGGKRTSGLASVIGLHETNQVLLQEDLPQIQIYDDGYFDDSGTFQLFIPNNKTVIIGERPAGSPVAEYLYVRNINNPAFEAGPYMKVVDNDTRPPRTFEVHDGHNGGPAIYYPSAVVILTTT